MGEAEPLDEAKDDDVFGEWHETLDTLRDQAESLSQSISDAMGGPEETWVEEGDGTVEEKIARLFEAINNEKVEWKEAIKKALILERDVWNRTFAKSFTERVNEVRGLSAQAPGARETHETEEKSQASEEHFDTVDITDSPGTTTERGTLKEGS